MIDCLTKDIDIFLAEESTGGKYLEQWARDIPGYNPDTPLTQMQTELCLFATYYVRSILLDEQIQELANKVNLEVSGFYFDRLIYFYICRKLSSNILKAKHVDITLLDKVADQIREEFKKQSAYSV